MDPRYMDNLEKVPLALYSYKKKIVKKEVRS